MDKKFLKNSFVSIFVILWLIVFHYESLRHFYLRPLSKRDLPKIPFLFPPAGWIMFYNVGNNYGLVEVYGIKDNIPQLIDPHDILRTRTIGFDNIHRNVLSEVASPQESEAFCRFLRYRYPYFDRFIVSVVYYPSLTEKPLRRLQEIKYQCSQ